MYLHIAEADKKLRILLNISIVSYLAQLYKYAWFRHRKHGVYLITNNLALRGNYDIWLIFFERYEPDMIINLTYKPWYLS